MTQTWTRSALALCFLAGAAGAADAKDAFEAFLRKHCLRCHGPEMENGELRIDRLSRDFGRGAGIQHWAEVMEKVNAGERSPKKEPRPTQAEIAGFVADLGA